MNYIEANLASDEKVVAQIKHSRAGLVPAFIIFILVCTIGIVLITVVSPLITNLVEEDTKSSGLSTFFKILFSVIGALTIFGSLNNLIFRIMEIACSQLIVTNKRILGRRGFISKQTTDIMLSKVDTVNAENSFFGAIFHYGYIQIISAASGTSHDTLKYNYISNTLEFRKAVLEAIEKAKAQEREEQAKVMRDAMKPNGEY